MVRSKVTRRDVARMAGTSVAVVSYVVNNGPRPVAPDTRERVLNAIKKTGYHPDPIAKALASGSTTGVGLVVPNIANPFLASLAHAIGQEVYGRGRVMLLADSADDPHQQRDMVEKLSQQQVGGLVFYGVDRDHDFIETYAKQLPIVVLDDPGSHDGIGYVRNDEKHAAQVATEHLVHHGYNEIGIIAGPLELSNSQERLAGWGAALDVAGQVRGPVVDVPFTAQGGSEALSRFGDQLPRAVFVSNEQQALGFLAAAHHAGHRVPEDIAVVTFNGTHVSQYTVPSLSAVEQQLDDVAKIAVDMVTAPAFQPEAIVHRGVLVARHSCGCGNETCETEKKTS